MGLNVRVFGTEELLARIDQLSAEEVDSLLVDLLRG